MKITSTFSASFFFSFYSAGLGLLSVNESINIQIFTLQVYTFVCQFCTCSQIKIYKFLSFATLLLQFKKKNLFVLGCVCIFMCMCQRTCLDTPNSRSVSVLLQFGDDP